MEVEYLFLLHTAQKMKFSIKDFFSKCDQIRRKLRIWSHLLKKSLIENFIFCTVTERVAVIYFLKDTLFISWEIMQSSIVWVILSAVICLFPKKVVATRFFRGVITISLENLQPFFHSTICLFYCVHNIRSMFAVISFSQGTVFIS